MLSRQSRRRLLALSASGLALSLTLAGCSGGGGGSSDGGDGKVTLSMLIPSAESDVATFEALIEEFQKQNPNITVKTETRPGGAEGDNIIKTKLSTGEMNDIFQYNSGSLLQALNPDQTLVDLSDEDYIDKLADEFKTVVSGKDGIYGVPYGQAMAGAVIYNKDIYTQLGLEVPKTWDEFMANNQKIKDAGTAAPIAQTYGATWTSQLFVLGDFYNVLAQDPDWAEKYTNNKAKFADEPGLEGFQHQEEAFKAGFFNEDFASATYEDGVRMVATGEAAHYPILTFAAQQLGVSNPEAFDIVGTFPLPGDDAEKNGLTVWMPAGMYIPKSTEGAQLEAAKKFNAFMVTTDACDIQSVTIPPQGPFVIDGCELPEDVPAMISDMQPYFDEEGKTAPALEFLSPIKGPALEQITVAVGSGITSAKEGAAQYDEDVKKQAEQLGLEGW